MLYPKNYSKEISKELFLNPTSEYRATPFWAWNTKLDQKLLNKEIDCMKEMGFGGFHMHTRVGMSTKYLSEEFMQFIKDCIQKAKEEDMLAWLYDEDKWPSGFAGGYVTKNPEFRQKHLLFTPYSYEQGLPFEANKEINDASAHAERFENGTLLAKYNVILDNDGYLKSYKRLTEEDIADGDIWYAYLETAVNTPWFNNQAYVDTLNKKAIDEFIKTTHEEYKKAVGDDFGGDIPAIFTDEPQFTKKSTLSYATDKTDICIPFTTDFEETFKATYGESILDKLPEVFFELKNKVSYIRYSYHDHVAERFATAFADNVGSWCKENGIMLTGHVMEEPTLERQTHSTGEAMRSYRSFSLPGVDMLQNYVELTTVKQAASASHQYACPGVLSELYGVTNWDFDFRGHKLQGDWQAALGVSVRVPHLYWVAMGGEAKRDYPASIGHQSPWYKEYSYIEDHFARVNTVMTRGKADIKIGVIHPVESFWLHYGPKEQTSKIRKEMDERFSQITNWLLYNTLDFDFICESLLPTQFKESDKGFSVGDMKYDCIIIPSMETIRTSTLKCLEQFIKKGGKVVVMGSSPVLADAKPSKLPAKTLKKAFKINWSLTELLNILEENRDVEILDEEGSPSTNLIYGLRKDGSGKNLFVAHVITNRNKDITDEENYKIKIKGEFAPTLLNSITGEMIPLPCEYNNGNTIINWSCYTHSSILIRLENGTAATINNKKIDKELVSIKPLSSKVNYSLSEQNVYMLDLAEWAIDDEEWNPLEETLRICDKAKINLGYSLDGAGGCQPWINPEKPELKNIVRLKYTINSDIVVKEAYLALENLDVTEIELNGKEVKPESVGKYVDIDIDKVKLPIIKRGENTLILSVKFGPLTCIENSFILGEFGVEAIGSSAKIVDLPEMISFGDITRQGFPFYGGNIIYHINIEGDGTEKTVKLDRFEAPVVTAFLDKERKGVIAFAPYTINLGVVKEGSHTLSLCAYGNRVNTFGALHNADKAEDWYGPQLWRPREICFSYDYQLHDTGILTTPKIYSRNETE